MAWWSEWFLPLLVCVLPLSPNQSQHVTLEHIEKRSRFGWSSSSNRAAPCSNVQYHCYVMLCLVFERGCKIIHACSTLFFKFYLPSSCFYMRSISNFLALTLILIILFVFWPHTSRVLRAHVCPSSKTPLLGMFVWNKNVCQTPWSSHLSVGGHGYPACLGDASWRVRVVDRGDVLSV